MAARSFQESSTERQHNLPGDPSSPPGGNRDVRDSKSCNYEATSVKKRGDPSSPSSSDDSSDEDAGRDRGRKRDDDHRRGRRDGHRHSRSRRSSSRSSSPRRHHSSSVNHKRWLKPEKFDGRSSFETFMYMFENCAIYNKWKQDDKVAHLRWSLTGPAAQLLWDSSGASYEQLVDKLRARFGGKGMEERFQTELRCRRRSK